MSLYIIQTSLKIIATIWLQEEKSKTMLILFDNTINARIPIQKTKKKNNKKKTKKKTRKEKRRKKEEEKNMSMLTFRHYNPQCMKRLRIQYAKRNSLSETYLLIFRMYLVYISHSCGIISKFAFPQVTCQPIQPYTLKMVPVLVL